MAYDDMEQVIQEVFISRVCMSVRLGSMMRCGPVLYIGEGGEGGACSQTRTHARLKEVSV